MVSSQVGVGDYRLKRTERVQYEDNHKEGAVTGPVHATSTGHSSSFSKVLSSTGPSVNFLSSFLRSLKINIARCSFSLNVFLFI